MQWMTLFKKEMVENWRNKKWVWVPLVFILLAVMDPISNYYMADILGAVGGLPDGAVFEMPDFTPPEVVMMSLGQLSSLGVLIIVLISMGTISGEIKNGVSELILVKPISYTNYITAKWTALMLLSWGALIIGMLGSWYYINILYGEISIADFLSTVFFYGLWLTFIVSLSIFFNTISKTPGLVAFLTILTIMVMSALTKVFQHLLEWSPNNLSSYIMQMLIEGNIPSNLTGTALTTVGLSILLLIFSIVIFRKREIAN
ncbi:ABC transporter permease [Oceanobacillus halophilus]|uniref:ABC transporter permease n=1 Tax=Oceanobacillus halophilus TaxID=930130 RepID=A0A494ZXH0_9BACI|nr:ABC transporter permease subunit [Oceanobacillus halophilus]RKQ31393.1 ABC transporter permease [Oceanobacillus halophilus]